MITQPAAKTPIDLVLVVQSLLALILIVTLCAMMVMQLPLPDLLLAATGTVLGWYFGSRTPASVTAQVAQSIKAFSAAVGD